MAHARNTVLLDFMDDETIGAVVRATRMAKDAPTPAAGEDPKLCEQELRRRAEQMDADCVVQDQTIGQLLAQEPQTAAAAVFLGAYPFPDSASLTRNEALSYAAGKMPQLTQECRLSFFSNQHLNTTQRNIRKQVENNHGNITSNYLAGSGGWNMFSRSVGLSVCGGWSSVFGLAGRRGVGGFRSRFLKLFGCNLRALPGYFLER